MIYVIGGFILLFDYAVFRVASRCSRMEEEIEFSRVIDKMKKI